MPLIRALARPLLASTFLVGGVETLRNPEPKIPKAAKVVGDLHEKLPALSNTKQVVQADAALKVVAGGMLALGKFPRISSLALAASLAPTTIAGHRFWEEKDPGVRQSQLFHFFKNVSLLGGLIIAAVDTEGRPSLGYRAKRAPTTVKHAAAEQLHKTEAMAASALRSAKDAVADAKGAVADALPG
ncbi:MAG: DoxX family protein [Actinomycetota bacterium]